MTPLIILSCLLIQCSYGLASDALWEQWKFKFGKQYGPEDGPRRRQIWNETVRAIAEHNLKYDLGLVTYGMGLNQFSDMSWEEFKSKFALQNMAEELDKIKTNINDAAQDDTFGGSIPDAVDWRNEGLVTDVEFQGTCRSCWSFSVAGVVEARYKKKHGELVSFSKQEMVDCGSSFHLHACQSGWTPYAFNYIIAKGLASAETYPYYGYPGQCRRNMIAALAKGYNFTFNESGSDAVLTQTIANLGPIAVCNEMDWGFQNYRYGIYTSQYCQKRINHAMLAVGYGSENALDYFIVKNSFGTHWGENGYIRFGRNMDNMCGIASCVGSIELE